MAFKPTSTSMTANQPRFSNAVLGGIASVMSVIDANEMTKLMISDVGGMVIPRTWSELSKRGIDAGRECFTREIMGTLVNVYLGAWFGALSMVGIHNLWKNPKAVNLRAWIPGNRLDYLSDIYKETLKQAKNDGLSGVQVMEQFVTKALNRIDSTDGIPNIKAYQKYFPHQGRLAPEVKDTVHGILTGRNKTFGYNPNLDELVHHDLKAPEIKAAWQQARHQWLEQFRKRHALPEHQALDPHTYPSLRPGLQKAQRSFEKGFYNQLRLQLGKSLRPKEAPLLDYLAHMAIEKGGVTEDIYLRDAKGHVAVHLDSLKVRDYFKNIKHYLEEYLTRSLANPKTGRLSHHRLSSKEIKAAEKLLYHVHRPDSLLHRLWPTAQDGLLSYTYKIHRSVILTALFATLAIGCSTAYLDHQYTKRKHKGKVFFPGENFNEDQLGDTAYAMKFAGQSRFSGFRAHQTPTPWPEARPYRPIFTNQSLPQMPPNPTQRRAWA